VLDNFFKFKIKIVINGKEEKIFIYICVAGELKKHFIIREGLDSRSIS
jgi:hypothetical protein